MRRVLWCAVAVGVFLAAGVAGLYIGRASARLQRADVSQARLDAARKAWKSGAYPDVVRLLGAVPDSSSFAAQARFLEGRSLWKMNRWQAAEEAWQRALELDPLVPEAVSGLLDLYFVEQRSAEAERLCVHHYPIEPDPHDRTLLLLELVRQDAEQLNPGDAARLLEPIVTLEPENYHAVRVLGRCYVQLGRVSEGLALVKRAIGMRPEDTEAWFTLVWCLSEGGSDRLGGVWDRLPAGALDEARFLRCRGIWAEASGDPDEARRACESALARDPYDRKAHYQLARLLRRGGETVAAEQHEAATQRLDDARELLGACYTQARQQQDEPAPELCDEFRRLCHVLGRTAQADLWAQEAERRGAAKPPETARDTRRSASPPLPRPTERIACRRVA
jgi:tetratricopeptide (TPR) repeat protein